MNTILITSATSEWTFSAVKRINTYLLSSFTFKCSQRAYGKLGYNFKAQGFVEKHEERKRYFGNFLFLLNLLQQ